MDDARTRRVLYALGAVIVLAYFFFFTWKSLSLYFDPDDMMNLYQGWNPPVGDLLRATVALWSGSLRPLGSLAYRAVFAMVGFHPLPFHVLMLAIGVINLGLCFRLAQLVSGSERTAAFAALLFAFHTRLMEIWFRPAMIFDALCFAFLYLAICLWISERNRSRPFRAWRIAAILLCFVGALGSKEMAISLPAMLIAGEWIFPRADAGRLVRFRLLGVMSAITAVYIYGRLRGPQSLVNNPAYAPAYTSSRWLDTWGVYFGHLFVTKTDLSGWTAMAILAALLLIAALATRLIAMLAAHSRTLLFAWVLIFFGLLPVAFVPARGAYVIYISWAGWCLYAGELLSLLAGGLAKLFPRYGIAVACVVFLIAGWRIGKLNLHDQRGYTRAWLNDPPRLVRAPLRSRCSR